MSHQAIEKVVAEMVEAGAVPIVLGGDHSIAEADIRACAAAHGPLGLVHFDTHTDTGREVYGVDCRTEPRCSGSSKQAWSTRAATCRSASAVTVG